MAAQVCLVSPLHDPSGSLFPYIKKYGVKLHRIYQGSIAISATASTASKVIHELFRLEFHVVIQSEKFEKEVGSNYRKAMQKGLESDAGYYHLIDFDRALHWVKRFPDELKKVVLDLPQTKGLTCYARSKRAYETHPLVQRTTEETINAMASEILGKDVDICSGSMGMDKASALLLVEKAKNKDYGIYAELLKIAIDNVIPVHSYEVEGLEWETPDQFEKNISRNGYVQWLHEYESLSQWEKRITLIDDVRDELL